MSKEDIKKHQWKKGQSGNPAGRPPGAISVIKRVREKFADNPEAFEAFIAEYIEDPANRKHVVEMLDGKPQQKTDITSGGDKIVFIPSEIANKNNIETNDTNE